ncbi:MAG: hypothetical protein ACRC68_11720, partial [Clostridium sp.]
MKLLKISLVGLILTLFVGYNKITPPPETETIINKPLPGYTYDNNSKQYINKETGVWYVLENDKNVIPKDQFIEKGIISNVDDFIIENRDNDVWQQSKVKEVIVKVKVKDNFYSLANSTYTTHYRMDADWYYEQVKTLNNLEDIDIILFDKDGD